MRATEELEQAARTVLDEISDPLGPWRESQTLVPEGMALVKDEAITGLIDALRHLDAERLRTGERWP